tara:strand:- start:7451 stop:8599 length:1149 start_codon:yes stop_codon:yes gene_type:complete
VGLSSASEFSVDIVTRVVQPDEDIYIVQPGSSYWLYETFKANNHIFLDFPALPLTFSTPAPDDKTLRQMVVRSLAMGEWIDSGKQGKQPSQLLSDYVGKDSRKRLGRYVGAIKRLYWDLKPGAIIVVPGRRFYDEVMIGEIVGVPTMYSAAQIYGGETVPARKVRWLRSKPRSAFSAELRDKFGKPNPLTQLDRSLRVEILRAGYDQYVFDNEFTVRLNTTEDDFTTLDDYNIQTFVNYVGGILIAVELGRTDKISFEEAIRLLRDHPDLVPDLKQSINSIGFQRLVAATVKPLVIGVLLTAATAPAAAGAAQPVPAMVTVTNSAAPPDDPCTIHVAARVEGAMKLMKLDDWRRVCESARDAKAATGLSTTMKAKPRKRLTP